MTPASPLPKLLSGVSFATSVYEKDWRHVLPNGRLAAMIERCQYPFRQRLLILNNIQDLTTVLQHTTYYQAQSFLDQVYSVADHADDLLRYFKIGPQNLYPGYDYLLQNLAAIYFCPTEYLLWMTCDSMMANAEPWIDAALERLKAVPWLVAANPIWNFAFDEAQAEALKQDQAFYLAQGFTDQCFLIPVAPYRAAIYAWDHPASARYPEHAGYSFERRVDSWMQSQHLLRLIHKKAVYVHRNFDAE